LALARDQGRRASSNRLQLLEQFHSLFFAKPSDHANLFRPSNRKAYRRLLMETPRWAQATQNVRRYCFLQQRLQCAAEVEAPQILKRCKVSNQPNNLTF